MRGRRLKKAGRRAALFMAFMMAFSATSTYTVQTIEAANAALGDMRSEEELKAMVSVGTVVREDWQKDARLKQLLTERDLKAAEYARENNLNGVYNTSGSIGSYGDSSNEWLSNVLYKGDILRYDTFDGFIAVYNGGADAAVIEDGINEIDVLLIPISDLQVSANGIETDISTWETIPGFASRIMLPHWNGEDGIDLKHRRAYRTKLFVVGVRGGALAKGGIYDKDNKLDYASYLSYIGAEASTENLASYMSYLKTYDDITDDDWDEWEDWDEWYDWYDWNQGDGSGGSKDSGGRSTPAGGDTPVDPGRPAKGRTIMIYMDGADLTESATLNLYTMLTASNTGDIGEDNHIVVLTGGSKDAWTRSDDKKVDEYLYNTNGQQKATLASTLGKTNQLWE
ncbi:MAG: hypothetical protein IIU07_03465, partial [Lachnospiraceae bacterium]|nr:hypothetical protein [Lachnospiraceae bacterium]